MMMTPRLIRIPMPHGSQSDRLSERERPHGSQSWTARGTGAPLPRDWVSASRTCDSTQGANKYGPLQRRGLIGMSEMADVSARLASPHGTQDRGWNRCPAMSHPTAPARPVRRATSHVATAGRSPGTASRQGQQGVRSAGIACSHRGATARRTGAPGIHEQLADLTTRAMVSRRRRATQDRRHHR